MTKLILTSLVVALSPAVAFAGCNYHANEDVTMSCGEGSVYDADTQKCVPQTTS